MYVDVSDVNVVEISEVVAGNFGESKDIANYKKKTNVEMVAEDHVCNNEIVTEDQYAEKMKVAYPKDEEDLIDFLNICKISNFATMLCPRCSVVFDKEAAKNIEGFRPCRSDFWISSCWLALTSKI